jgi:replication factor A1
MAAEELSKKILDKTGKTGEWLNGEVSARQTRFSGLLTEEGALELVAREHGVPSESAEQVFRPVSLSQLAQGDTASALVRALQIFAPKVFKKNERSGKVCNVFIADESARGTFVLWNDDVDLIEKGKIKRNDLLRISNATVKSIQPLELHSSLLTEVVVSSESSLIPENKVPLKRVADLKEGDNEFDFFAKITSAGELREFSRQEKKSFVLNVEVADETGSAKLVLWDRNAELGARLKDSDVLKVEGAYFKNGEIHCGWQGRVFQAENHSLQTLSQKTSETAFNVLEEGKEATVSATLSKVFDAKSFFKCKSCGSRIDGEACSCGGEKREVVFASTELIQGEYALRCVFFGNDAKKLLGVRGDTDVATAFELKRDYLTGKKIILTVLPKSNAYSGKLECTCKKIISFVS